MKKIKIFHRMLLTLLIAIVGTAAVAGSWLYDTYAIQVHDRQEKTRQLVEVAHSLLSYFEAAEREGKDGPRGGTTGRQERGPPNSL